MWSVHLKWSMKLYHNLQTSWTFCDSAWSCHLYIHHLQWYTKNALGVVTPICWWMFKSQKTLQYCQIFPSNKKTNWLLVMFKSLLCPKYEQVTSIVVQPCRQIWSVWWVFDRFVLRFLLSFNANEVNGILFVALKHKSMAMFIIGMLTC